MLLSSKDGITCDYCGTIYKDQFTYYSTKATEHELINNRRSTPRDANFHSDMCVACYEMLLKDVKNNLGKHRKDKIKCDLSNIYKSGTFVYYIMLFDKVDVGRSQNKDNEVKIQRNIMDLNIINGFDKLLERTQVIKKKIEKQGTWS